MLRSMKVTIAVFGLFLGACDRDASRTEDSDAATGVDEGASEAPSEESSGTNRTTCDAARDTLRAFVEQNQSCEDVDDCQALEALCYPFNNCAAVAVRADVDLEVWQTNYATLSSGDCPEFCSADPCGGSMKCIENVCVIVSG